MADALDYDDLAFIVHELGRTATTVLSGAHHRNDVEAWLSGRSAPNEAQIARINFASGLFKQVSMSQGEHRTHDWFFGPHVGSDNVSPVIAIGDNRLEEVRKSAAEFIQNK